MNDITTPDKPSTDPVGAEQAEQAGQPEQPPNPTDEATATAAEPGGAGRLTALLSLGRTGVAAAVVAVVLLVGAGAAGFAIAGGDGGDGADGGRDGRGGPGNSERYERFDDAGSDETPLTGDVLTQVAAAVEETYPGALIERAETDADGVYEAHVTTADGEELTVELDENFAVTGTEDSAGDDL